MPGCRVTSVIAVHGSATSGEGDDGDDEREVFYGGRRFKIST